MKGNFQNNDPEEVKSVLNSCTEIHCKVKKQQESDKGEKTTYLAFFDEDIGMYRGFAYIGMYLICAEPEFLDFCSALDSKVWVFVPTVTPKPCLSKI